MRKLSDITRILNVREVDGNPNVSNVYTIVVSNGSLTDNGGGQVTINTGGGGGGSLTVQEIDGTPNVGSVSTIRVSNGTLTDDGGGQVTINTTGGGSYTDEQAQDAVGTILTDTSEIDLTYNDSTPSISAAVISIAQSKITNLTTDLANKQPLDSTLTSLAAYNTNGYLVQTSADTFAGRTFQNGTGISITNPGGTPGDTTINCTITQYTDELAQDAIGLNLLDTSTVNLTYNDSTGQISADVIVSGLSGIAESQVTNLVSDLASKVPTSRNLTATSPITGGGDLSADRSFGFDQSINLNNNARVTVRKNTGADVGARRRINFIEGSNITITISDDSVNEEIDITIASSGGGGGSGNAGITTVDFGAFPGKTDASVDVTGQTGILSNSIVNAHIYPSATADHSADEHMVEKIKVYADASTIIAGTGFTIKAFSDNNPTPYPEYYPPKYCNGPAINVNGIQGGVRTTPTPPCPMIYGLWSVAWDWR